MGFYEDLINQYEKKAKFDFHSYRNNILIKIGDTIAEMTEVQSIEKYISIKKYVKLFDELVITISNCETKNQVFVFNDAFENYKKLFLNEFKNEFCIRYGVPDRILEGKTRDSVIELYNELKKAYRLYTGEPILKRK